MATIFRSNGASGATAGLVMAAVVAMAMLAGTCHAQIFEVPATVQATGLTITNYLKQAIVVDFRSDPVLGVDLARLTATVQPQSMQCVAVNAVAAGTAISNARATITVGTKVYQIMAGVADFLFGQTGELVVEVKDCTPAVANNIRVIRRAVPVGMCAVGVIIGDNCLAPSAR